MSKILQILSAAALALALLVPVSAVAEVRFGNNVRIGGHDFSNQTFNSRRRGVVHLYRGKPRNEGCTWRKQRDGSRVKVCHLQKRSPR